MGGWVRLADELRVPEWSSELRGRCSGYECPAPKRACRRAAAMSALCRSERVATASAGASERRGEQGEELHDRGHGGRS